MPSPPEPVGVYEPFTRCGDLVFLSAISSARDGAMITGKVGRDLTLDEGREAARRAAANLLAVLETVGEVQAVLMVRGQVNAADDFGEVHKVIDAASELIIERLGDKGRHARTAIGCATLPNNNAVTLEAIVRVSA